MPFGSSLSRTGWSVARRSRRTLLDKLEAARTKRGGAGWAGPPGHHSHPGLDPGFSFFSNARADATFGDNQEFLSFPRRRESIDADGWAGCATLAYRDSRLRGSDDGGWHDRLASSEMPVDDVIWTQRSGTPIAVFGHLYVARSPAFAGTTCVTERRATCPLFRPPLYRGFTNRSVIRSLSPIAAYFARSTSFSR